MSGTSTTASASGGVDDAMLVAADANQGEWLSYGRTYDEQRFSPLTAVNDTNVGQLGLAWSADMDTARGQEATPLMHDGKLYVSTAWSMVKAYDATTGKLLWSYDPKVPREVLVNVCCDAVNRGVAIYDGKIYVGTLAGHLVALDAKTGAVVWDKKTTPEGSPMVITGAPRIVKGKVLIGSAGAEYITRGYLAAYDAKTGNEAWRFYTVPGDPSKPFEGKHLEAAAKTWAGEWWKRGGGGTVWDSITYDPTTNLVYFGTANAEPWNPAARGSEGGDSLYTASIVAVNPDTGEYVWHYQETPEDRWDFDSNQQIIAATIQWNGAPRRVLMHAPKNGFFYILDAKTGQFLSGKPFAVVTWASGLDPVTGRPNVNPAAKYEQTGKPWIGMPGAIGAHSWTPMSYSPKTGLVYIPANQAAQPYNAAAKDWKPSKLGFQLGLDSAKMGLPADPAARAAALAGSTGSLIAWDPIAGKPRWTVQYAGPTNGGTLATAGNLVFQGTAGGEFRAYSADAGKLLWKFPVQTGVLAAPMTYAIGNEQYVAILVGWGGVWDVSPGLLASKSGSTRNISRLLVFKLGAKGTLPAAPPESQRVLDPPPFTGTEAQVSDGAMHYQNSCSVCHGDSAVAGGLNPDLRHSAALSNPQLWQQIVHDGVLKDMGMVGWAANFSSEQIENIRQYVIKRANEDKALEGKAAPGAVTSATPKPGATSSGKPAG
ncbi:PQQ-dependent dehydrogenase, methanol/ethanol family [Novosphingobium tardum]|uniref:PQQ-dependent dehydrogenase, methanol/ethanol family n=1 Tax=Novosphingobium tardum TaxID=1538021 RepID=A0ABV8RS30_9SPHN